MRLLQGPSRIQAGTSLDEDFLQACLALCQRISPSPIPPSSLSLLRDSWQFQNESPLSTWCRQLWKHLQSSVWPIAKGRRPVLRIRLC